jgi:hypothetical protein
MKMMQNYAVVLGLALPLTAALSLTTTAQTGKAYAPQQQHMLMSTNNIDHTTIETLSGINLRKASKGTYQLYFSQKLKENAVLEISNKTGQLVYQKPVSISKNKSAWRYNVGTLKPDTYLIEVKTSDTTYWTKFKVGR